MSRASNLPRQQGVALVFSLLILLILTIVGVASMSNTQMQERMAGNVNLASIAFEAASSGVSQALDYGMDFWDTPGCTRESGAWTGTYSDPVALGLAGAQQNLTIQYRLKADCLEDPGFGPDPTDPTYLPPVQMYVTSQGAVSANGEVLLEREIEVRIDSLRTDGRSAIRVEGEPTVVFGAPRSNRFSVDGAGGPAISTSTLANAQTIATEIGTDRLGNYDGGVARSDYDSPFNSAWRMARFALEIKAFMEFHGYVGTPHTTAAECNTISELQSDDLASALGEPYQTQMALIDGDYSIGGSTDFDGVTYVTGDLDMSGTPRGQGIVIVEGRVFWSGKADFQGTVLALGGLFDVSGGGSGTTDGTVFASNIDLARMQPAYDTLKSSWSGLTWEAVLALMDLWGNPDATDLESTEYRVLDDGSAFSTDGFGPTEVDLDGGGNHTIVYDCKKVDDFRVVLSECGEVGLEDSVETGTNGFIYDGLADPWLSQLCNTPGEGGQLQALRSWRENLGWRELLDSGT